MVNETLIQIPIDLNDPKRLSIFLKRLVEKLDIVLGFRGSDKYVAQSELDTTNNAVSGAMLTLSQVQDLLEATILRLDEELAELTETVTDNTDRLDTIQDGTTVADLSYTAITASAGYVQSEAQAVADQLETTSDRLDALLAVLRIGGLIS